MYEDKKIIPENAEIQPLTDEQLEEVNGGALMTIRLLQNTYVKCAIDPQHPWPNGAKVCPVCGSTEFIRNVRQGR